MIHRVIAILSLAFAASGCASTATEGDWNTAADVEAAWTSGELRAGMDRAAAFCVVREPHIVHRTTAAMPTPMLKTRYISSVSTSAHS